MNKIVICLSLLFLLLLFTGCTTEKTKIQCQDGSVADSVTLCPQIQNTQTAQTQSDPTTQLKEKFAGWKSQLNDSDLIPTGWVVYKYDQNPLTADENYKNRYGYNYGQLIDIGRLADGTVYATFSGPGSRYSKEYIYTNFICYVLDEKELLAFKKGDMLKFVAYIIGQDGDVYAYCSYFEKYT